MKTILVPIDFSEVSRAVVATAESLARAFSAKIWLIHVAAPEPDFVGFDVGPQSVRDQRADHLRDEHRRIQDEANRLRDAEIDATALLVQGPTVDKILAEAERLEVDWIVLGSHGHGAAYRALLGSVSEYVVRRSNVPVTIVPLGMLTRGNTGTGDEAASDSA
jgi:nucleotide-binding universal stress UspA family protein